MNTFRRFRQLPGQRRKAVLIRYTCFQLPDLLILLLVLALLGQWVDIPARWKWGVIVFWVLKDIALFPLLWPAYEKTPSHVRDTLIGARGLAAEKLDPFGYIRIQGVLWQAKVCPGECVEKGDPVQVEGVDGIVLTVRHCGREEKADPPGG